MRKPIIIGNWKMNMSLKGSLCFLSELEKNVNEEIEVGIASQSVSLVKMISHSNNILIGAQNCFYEESGPYTGEISPGLLKEIKTKFCLVGHSERRTLFNETNEIVNKKACKLLENNIAPVICVGETFEQHEKKQTKKAIVGQIRECCQNLKIENCLIAYEPVWAIGTDEMPRLDEIQVVAGLIRNELTKMYSAKQAAQVRIQYGGSVSEDNIKQLLKLDDIDGALVGGASLKIKSFSKIITA